MGIKPRYGHHFPSISYSDIIFNKQLYYQCNGWKKGYLGIQS